ncbi:MAG: trigger factor [Lachnospiraceae bacterium]|nr:trigger factor [Lachnospiraceae bacterium]
MKKKLVVLFLCMAMTAFAGCGDKNENAAVEGTETAVEETLEAETTENVTEYTGAKSTDIVYDVNEHVTLGDYMNVEVTLNEEDYVVDDEAIKGYADQMIAYYNPFVADESKTTVEKGDIVEVDYVGKKDGEAFDGGSAEGVYVDTATNTDAQRGTGYIDGFSDGLIGANVGDTVDCEVTFPEDYSAENLKGQTVTFTFTIHSISTKMTSENIDDAFVKENFEVDTVDAYFEDVKTYLEQQAQLQKETDIRNGVIDAVIAKCTVDSVPEGLTEARTEEYIDGFVSQYCTDGTTLEEFLMTNYYTTEEDFRAQTAELMKENVEQELIFEAIVKAENIEFDQADFDKYMDNLVANGGFASKEEVYSTYGPNETDGEVYLKNIYLQNKACNLITEKAVIHYEKPEDTTESVAETTE